MALATGGRTHDANGCPGCGLRVQLEETSGPSVCPNCGYRNCCKP